MNATLANRALVAFVGLVAVAGCDPVALLTFDSTVQTSSPDTQVVTADGTDSYTFTASSGEIAVAAAPDDVSGNLRALFWPADGPDVSDAMSCATWRDQHGDLIQQGAALRIIRDASGTRAVTVTKNVWEGAYWIFNFHAWDTTAPDAYTQIGAVDLTDYLRDPATLLPRPLPWNFCARAIGGRLAFKVWLDGDAEPAWYDATRGGSIALPDAYAQPGKAGWYIGHLPPDGSATYTNLRAWRYVDSTTTTTVGTGAAAPTLATPTVGLGAVTIEGDQP